MTLIADIQCFPPSIFFKEVGECSHCIFDQYDTYRKMTFRNRSTLSGSNGPINLSVPLVGGRGQKLAMKDVRVENRDNWQTRHWKTIESCYNKSPFLYFYKDELRTMFEKKYSFLIDWNMDGLEWVCAKMAIKTNLGLSDSYLKKYDGNEYTDLRNRLTPSTINKSYPSAIRYPQVFEDRFGFIPNLSVLDQLFCNGNKL